MTNDVAEGTASITLLLCLFGALLYDSCHYALRQEYSNHLIAFVLASLLHIIGTRLIHNLEYTKHCDSERHHGEERKPPPLSTFSIQPGEMATISDITTAQSEDLHNQLSDPTTSPRTGIGQNKSHKGDDPSSYMSMETTTTGVGESGSYDDELDHALECAYGFTFPLAQFLLCTLFLSSALLIVSISQQVSNIASSTETTSKKWTRAVFILTYGFFFSCTLLSHYKRYIAASFDQPMLRNRRLKFCLSGFLALVALVFLVQAWKVRKAALDQLGSFTSPFWGEAWVVEPEAADEDAFCLDSDDSILVNLTVVYGSDWACPNSPEQWCEVAMTTQLECTFFQVEFETDDGTDGDISQLSASEYVYMRYHDYNADDDAVYDYDEQPSFQYWNHPAEKIIGSCDGSCLARSGSWAWYQNQKFAQSSYGMYLSMGISLSFLGWPLYEVSRHLGHSRREGNFWDAKNLVNVFTNVFSG